MYKQEEMQSQLASVGFAQARPNNLFFEVHKITRKQYICHGEDYVIVTQGVLFSVL